MNESSFLFKLKHFIKGMPSAFDLSGSGYNPIMSPSFHETDIEALRSDWNAIGKDIGDAIDNLKRI